MKKNKFLKLVTAVVLAGSVLVGCGSAKTETTAETTPAASAEAATEAAKETGASEEVKTESEDSKEAAAENPQESKAAEESKEEETSASVETTETEAFGDTSEGAVRVGSLKGPTTMGLVNLMNEVETRDKNGYLFEMQTQPDVILGKLVKGDLDIALIPANLAAIAYNKTEQGVSVIDINTLGVLYCVTADDSIKSVKDLAGKTLLSTGQGATPEYAINFLLDKNEVTDCNIEFKSEATEIAALLQNDPNQIAVLPQPFVTVAIAQNDQLKVAFSLTDEWDAVSPESKLLTGVTVVRNDFLEANADKVEAFIEDHKASTEKANSDIEGTSELIAKYGIIAKAPIAAKAIPNCNIVAITGDEMKTNLSGYLQVLFDQNPKSVGGKLPGEDFYKTA
ncbi:NitT/TauT family transport system substrate-binding protein [Oribacterium sp. KHPX15]|uniref:ABC transporter substrate-binding protein n=1 Tax=Oribacterium sp. KHPX15 TaxID=1855342 RepID=UPI00089B4DE4|nr:ABC transporter substrate-binding protein [Oribacterium sp. KHPX15]SEA84454.1 NitT/TauT family transport system substrate-binding protein [Oribacterium sp. KHPX15]